MNPILPIEYLLLLLGLTAAAAGITGWRTAARSKTGMRVLLVALRLLGLAALGVAACNPGHWRRESVDLQGELAVLVDRSMSMMVADVDGKPRWDTARAMAKRLSAAAESKGVNVRVHTFAGNLDPGVSGALPAMVDGETTNIIRSARNLFGRHQGGGGRLRGMVIISDGRQVESDDIEDFILRARSMNTPAHVAPLGGEVATKNLSITPTRFQHLAFVGQPTTVGAVVASRGFGPLAINAALVGQNGERVAERRLELEPNSDTTVNFELVPAARGHYRYHLEIPVLDGENSAADNAARVGVSALDRRIRVLQIEGSPFWDSKFLAQLLRKQANMELNSIFRVASEKFFRVDTDPSVVTESAGAVFPDSQAEISAYDVIIFGKGAEYFLDDERIRLLRAFVRDQGGCLIFSRGKPYGGALPALEPLEPIVWGQEIEEEFYPLPTSAGEDSGLFGELLPGMDDPVWRRLPRLGSARRCSDLKTFTRVLAEGWYEVGGRERAAPLIASRRFGRGMVLAVNAEGMWKWDFFPAISEAAQMYKDFWTQLIQWGVVYSEYLPGQEYSLRLSDSNVLPHVPVRATIGYRGTRPVSTPPVLRTTNEDGGETLLATAPVGEESNRWEAIVSAGHPGLLVVELASAEWLPEDGGGPVASLLVRDLPGEADNPSADPRLLARIAEGTGGQVLDANSILDAFNEIETEMEFSGDGEAVWVASWDKWWLLAAALTVLAVEWFIRRRRGLV